MAEIQAIIRQITASVTFLPLLQDRCALFAPNPIFTTLWDSSYVQRLISATEGQSGKLVSC